LHIVTEIGINSNNNVPDIWHCSQVITPISDFKRT
jgi:hypothetical protein